MELIYYEGDSVPKKKRNKIAGAFLQRSEATTYLSKAKKFHRSIGRGVAAILAGVSAVLFFGNMGILPMFLGIAFGVGTFIMASSGMADYEGFEEIPLYLDDETYALIDRESIEKRPKYNLRIAIGVGSILTSIGAMITFGLNPGVILLGVGFACFLFITGGGYMSSYDMLLGKGDYKHKKARKQISFTAPGSSGERLGQSYARIEASTGNSELDHIVKEANGFIYVLNGAKAKIRNASVAGNTQEIITTTESVLDKLRRKPDLIGETGRFFDYFMPTTAKLVISYGEMEEQGIQSIDVQSSMSKIEHALKDLSVAYKARMDKMGGGRFNTAEGGLDIGAGLDNIFSIVQDALNI